MANIENISDIKLTRKQLSELFGYKNEKYINELERDFGLEKDAWNQYDLKKSVEWFINYKENIYAKEIEKIKADKPQDDLARKQAKLKQMDIEEREGRSIDSDLVRMKWLDEIKVFDLNIDSIEATLIISLKNLLTDVEKGNEIIKTTVRKTKEKIANTELDI